MTLRIARAPLCWRKETLLSHGRIDFQDVLLCSAAVDHANHTGLDRDAHQVNITVKHCV